MTTKKMKILVVCQHFWPETFRITDIVEGLIENGFEVDVLCGIPNYPTGKFFDGYGFFQRRRESYKGANIIRVPEIPRGPNTNFRIFLNYISFPFFALFYLPLLLTKKYDRVFIYQLSPVLMALPGIVLGKLQNIKIFIYILDFWPHSLLSIISIKNKFLLSLLTRISYWHYRQACGVIGVFKGIQTRLVNLVGLPIEKTLYIPQAAEKIYEQEIFDKSLFERFGGKFNIVFAGNINPAQSFETIIAAAKIVQSNGYNNVHYIIIGDGMSKKWLMQEVKAQGLEEAFSFEGFKPVDDIPKYQTLADALLVALSQSPLFEYGIPAKVQSYMAGGKPILGAMDGEGKRLINESGSGICVDSCDSNGLANSIISLINMSPEHRKSMGDMARSYNSLHFERNHNLARLIEFICNDTRISDTEYPDI